MNRVIEVISKILPSKIAFAHCDIPCGIYDPHNAQMGAHTVLRMTQLLSEVKVPEGEKVENIEYTRHHNDVARMIRVKEKHGELVEDELGTLENDYFKEEHYKKFPDLKKLIEEATKLSIKTRQNIDLESSSKMIDVTMQIAEIFYKTKDLEPVRISSGYPTGGEIVTHK